MIAEDPAADRVVLVALNEPVGPLVTDGETETPVTWNGTCTWVTTFVSTSAMSTPLTQILACQWPTQALTPNSMKCEPVGSGKVWE